jgi:hypothetical protein
VRSARSQPHEAVAPDTGSGVSAAEASARPGDLAPGDVGPGDLAPGDLGPAGDIDDSGRFAHDLEDALYYLRRGCVPCAERYFDRARRHGASQADIEAARLRASGDR